MIAKSLRLPRSAVPGAAVLVLLAALAPAAAQDAPPVATVNGTPITEEQVDMALRDFGAALGNVPEPQRRETVIGLLIDTHLLARAGEADGLDKSPGFDRQLAYLRDKALMDAMLARAAEGAVTDAAVQEVYDETVKGMTPEEEVRARHILTETEEEAVAAKKRVDGGEAFEEVAKEVSKDPGSGANGGDLGYFAKERMVPEFAEAAFALEPGVVSDPVQSQFGWHVIKVEDKRTQPLPELAAVREQIVSYIERRAQQQLVQGLRDKAEIERAEQPAAPAPGVAPDAGAAPAPGAPAENTDDD